MFLTAEKVDTGETVNGAEVTIQMAKDEGWYGKNGSKWKTMPELMLAYRASAFLQECISQIRLWGVQLRESGRYCKGTGNAVPDPFADSKQAQAEKEASEVFDNVVD